LIPNIGNGSQQCHETEGHVEQQQCNPRPPIRSEPAAVSTTISTRLKLCQLHHQGNNQALQSPAPAFATLIEALRPWRSSSTAPPNLGRGTPAGSSWRSAASDWSIPRGDVDPLCPGAATSALPR